MDDVTDPDWKVVRVKEPRSRRVTAADDDGNLSAAGSLHSTRNIMRHVPSDMNPNSVPGESIPRVELDQVMACEEPGEDGAAFEDVDHDDDSVPLDEAENVEGVDVLNAPQVPPSTPDAMDFL